MVNRPKPTHLKIIEGNPGKRRLNPKEPHPEPTLPTPPSILVGDALDEWNRVSVELYRLGCLTGLDRAALAAYCQAYGRWVAAERALEEIARQNPLASLMIKTSNGNAIQNPLVGIANRAAADMVRYATEFGMSPAARSKIEAGPTPAASKFEGLIGG
jgi:P27 family predicted phage terminase small subunit